MFKSEPNMELILYQNFGALSCYNISESFGLILKLKVVSYFKISEGERFEKLAKLKGQWSTSFISEKLYQTKSKFKVPLIGEAYE